MSIKNRKYNDINTFLAASPELARVRLKQVKGSAPREAGAWMLVSPRAVFATIGGGQLEYMAMQQARCMLENGPQNARFNIRLGSDAGQCCGGNVTVEIEIMNTGQRAQLAREYEDRQAAWPVVHIFGAGHTGCALARYLDFLPVRPVLVDTRKSALERAPVGVSTCLTAMPELVIRNGAPNGAYVIMTHDHALDFLIASEALARRDAAYAGMIGSKTKRAVFSRWFKQQNGTSEQLSRLVCPIGAGFSDDKRPEVIACFAAAEIMQRLTGSGTVLAADNLKQQHEKV